MHLVRKVFGTLLAIACFGLALYALVRLVQGGSCASGGNYVSTRQCQPGTGWWAVELPLGIIGGLLFLGLGYIKFGRAEQVPTTPPPRLGSTFTAQMFTADGERPAGWPSHLPWPPARVDWQHPSAVHMPNDGPGSPNVDLDPLLRLERLRALRDANALTTSEYEEAKAKILSQM
jgi:hypothetical protein